MQWKYIDLRLNEIQIINYNSTEDGSWKSPACQQTGKKKIDVIFQTPDFGQKK